VIRPPSSAARVFLIFPSTHQAIAAEETLRARGFSLQVLPPPPPVGHGCGLAIRLAAEDLPQAERLLRRGGIAWEVMRAQGR
jgi:hypothetical protein